MGVDPGFRRRGVGGRLLREALKLAQVHGLQKVTLAVDQQNTPALGLYQALGFRQVASRRAWVRTIAPSIGGT